MGQGGCRRGPTDESGGIMVDSLVIWFYHVFPYRHFSKDVRTYIFIDLAAYVLKYALF